MADDILRLARGEGDGPEIFQSIQGEGASMGRLRTFVRLSGCNLHCTWCDTPYTWNWTGTDFVHAQDRPGAPRKFDMARETIALPVDQVAQQILDLDAPGLVVTGGEPVIQHRALTGLLETVKAQRPQCIVEIETNGTLMPPERLLALLDQINVSPKLDHAGNGPNAALNRDLLRLYAEDERAVFKVVARCEADLDQIESLARDTGMAPSRLFVMPEGTDSETLRKRAQDLIGPVIARGWGFSDRLHIHLYGDRRST